MLQMLEALLPKPFGVQRVMSGSETPRAFFHCRTQVLLRFALIVTVSRLFPLGVRCKLVLVLQEPVVKRLWSFRETLDVLAILWVF